MFCSDDKHPDSPASDISTNSAPGRWPKDRCVKVLQAACINPIEHYKMDVGTLQPGDPARLHHHQRPYTGFEVLVYINGGKVAENGRSLIQNREGRHHQFILIVLPKTEAHFVMPRAGEENIERSKPR